MENINFSGTNNVFFSTPTTTVLQGMNNNRRARHSAMHAECQQWKALAEGDADAGGCGRISHNRLDAALPEDLPVLHPAREKSSRSLLCKGLADVSGLSIAAPTKIPLSSPRQPHSATVERRPVWLPPCPGPWGTSQAKPLLPDKPGRKRVRSRR